MSEDSSGKKNDINDLTQQIDSESLGDDFDFASLADALVQPGQQPSLEETTSETQVETNLTELLQSVTSTLQDELQSAEQDSDPIASELAVQTGVRHVLFEAGGHLFGLPLAGVREIDRCEKVTLLPRTPRWLRGLSNLRGQILSVTDFCEVLGLPASKTAHAEKIIVVRSEKWNTSTAIVVDRVLGIRGIQPEPVEVEDTTESLIQYAYGMALLTTQQQELETSSNVILLIDPDLLLGSDSLATYLNTSESMRN